MAKAKTSANQDPVSIGIDLGTGSLAVLARQGDNILWSKSILLEPTTASLAARRNRRRMIKTRLSHRAREFWWNQCARDAGIPLLKTITKTGDDFYKISEVDDRLKREHPEKDDETCYSGALLRIMILEGKIDELQPWQVYKAVHDAIQKRGYDPSVPWKSDYENTSSAALKMTGNQPTKKAKRTTKKATNDSDYDESPESVDSVTPDPKTKDDDKSTAKSVDEFMAFLNERIPQDNKRLCCYFEAYKSGLWDPAKGITSYRQTHEAEQRAITIWKGYIPPRSIVESELTRILSEVARRFPKINPAYVLYGPGLVSYSSHPKHAKLVMATGGQSGLIPGRPTDWKGVLGQKIPRFDNRAVGYCALIPRFKVCKVPDPKCIPATDKLDPRELRLFSKFVLLSRLKNLRVIKSGRYPEPLTPDECREAYHKFEDKLKFTKTELKEWLEQKSYKVAPGMLDELKGTKSSGRCAYSKPALRMICRWLYEGWDNSEGLTNLRKEFIKGNVDPLKGIVESDLNWVSRLAPNAWVNAFYVPHKPLDHLDAASADVFVGKIKYPVVRHRLGLLLRILREMRSDISAKGISLDDARVGLEVIKDESKQTFLGEMTKREVVTRMRNNEKINDSIRMICKEFKLTGRKEFEKVKLAYAQGFIDPYDVGAYRTAKTNDEARKKSMLSGIKKGIYDIDHIVPEEMGGPDEIFNKILTRKELNRDKKKRMTPFEWLSDSDKWDDYVRIVANLPSPTDSRPGIGNFTRRLLTSKDADDLVSKRTDLQATGYIEKAAQNLICLAFGWPDSQLKGSSRHVVCVPGRMTARVRAKCELNQILYPKPEMNSKGGRQKKSIDDDASKPSKRKSPIKNRDNPKHHILDAAILSFIPEWALNPRKNHFFNLPRFAIENHGKWFVKNVLATHNPIIWNVSKPELFETRKSFLDLADSNGTKYVTVKKHLQDGGTPSVEWKIAEIKNALGENKFNYPPGHKKDSPVTKALKKILRKDIKKIPNDLTVEIGTHEIALRSLKALEDFSPDRHLVSSDGGVLESERHKGVIIWRDAGAKRSTWKVAVVAAWSNAAETQKRLKANNPDMKIELWNNGITLKRGDTVQINTNEIDNLPSGQYVVASTKENGQVAFVGQKDLVIINKLIVDGNATIASQ
jgi:CRISPR-associated endonuclease Csn1